MATCPQCGRSLARLSASCVWCGDAHRSEGESAVAASSAVGAERASGQSHPGGVSAAPTPGVGAPTGPGAASVKAADSAAATTDDAEFERRHTNSWPPRPIEAPLRATSPGLRAAPAPLLASEVMRSDLSPAAPAVRRVRVSLAVLGAIGLAAAMLLVGPLAFGVVIGGAFAAIAALGVVPMAYQVRAAASVAIAGVGLAVTTWNRLQHGAGLDAVVLLMGVTLLGTALVFRGWHRGSTVARWLVACGIVVCATWLAIHGTIAQLVSPNDAWQAWLGPALELVLVAILLLSLLAFMDSRSTGACGVWAGVLLGWYALYTWAGLSTLYWPAKRSGGVQNVTEEFGLTLLATPILVCVLALGLSQLLAVAGAADAQPDSQRPR